MAPEVPALVSSMCLYLCLCLCTVGLVNARSSSDTVERSLGFDTFDQQQQATSGGSKFSSDEQSGSGNEGAGNLSGESGGYKVAQGALQFGENSKQEQSASTGPYESATTGGSKNKGELAPMYDLAEYAKLIFSPFELVKKISDAFKLPQEKFIEKLGKGLVFGVEAMLTPLVASLKIIEKVFVPDHCRLKFVCVVGSKFGFVKDTITKFSPNLLGGSFHLKALTDGMAGQNCETLFKECEPRLKKPYEDLKSSSSRGMQHY